MKHFFASLFLLSFTFIAAKAQPNPRLFSSNTNSWYMFFGNFKISPVWGIHAEAQLRRNDWIQNPQQLLLRTGIEYYLKDGIRFTAGYGFIKTHPYGEFPVANTFPEHRFWEQVLLNQPLGRVALQHRFRLEQRLLGNATTGRFDGGRYENRMRYMLRANIALQGQTIDPHEWYIGLYDEVMINFGREVGYNLFDQNRLYGAVGYHLGKAGRLEIGYLNQMIAGRTLRTVHGQSSVQVIENNHTLQLALFTSLDLFRQQ